MEIIKISKTMQEADSQAVAALIAVEQARGAFGRRVLQNCGRMGREQEPGSALVERVGSCPIGLCERCHMKHGAHERVEPLEASLIDALAVSFPCTWRP